jgi:hypothetical protein
MDLSLLCEMGDALCEMSEMRDALNKVNISLDKLITVLLGNGLSPLYGIANPRATHSEPYCHRNMTCQLAFRRPFRQTIEFMSNLIHYDFLTASHHNAKRVISSFPGF